MTTIEQIADEKAPGRVYEVAYLVSPNVSEDKVADIVGRLKTILEKQGAFILSDEFPKFRQLAYTLVKPLGGKNEKYSSAYFGWVKFEASASMLGDIQAGLGADPQLVRCLVVKVDKDSKFKSKPAFWRKDSVKRDLKPTGKVPTMTEAEIDKTIEELVVE